MGFRKQNYLQGCPGFLAQTPPRAGEHLGRLASLPGEAALCARTPVRTLGREPGICGQFVPFRDSLALIHHPAPALSITHRFTSYLTNSMPTLERFPISFKTYFSGNYFRHIVLGVNFGGRYGALGMSRREDLMYKPPAFRTLSELVLDYEAAYGRCWHVLKKVKLGQCVSHDPHSVEQIEWKHSVLDVERLGREDFRKELERHARDMRLKVRISFGPPAFSEDFPCFHWLVLTSRGCLRMKYLLGLRIRHYSKSPAVEVEPWVGRPGTLL